MVRETHVGRRQALRYPDALSANKTQKLVERGNAVLLNTGKTWSQLHTPGSNLTARFVFSELPASKATSC